MFPLLLLGLVCLLLLLLLWVVCGGLGGGGRRVSVRVEPRDAPEALGLVGPELLVCALGHLLLLLLASHCPYGCRSSSVSPARQLTQTYTRASTQTLRSDLTNQNDHCRA